MKKVMPMKTKIHILLILLMLILGLSGCGSKIEVKSENNVFSFSKLNDLIYELNIPDGEFSHLEGNNISDGDYLLIDDKLIIKKAYLTTLNPGEYEYSVVTTIGKKNIEVKIADENQKYQLINGDFETGDLFGWSVFTIFKGEDNIQSFVEEGIKENTTFFTFEVPYNGDGKYVYGLDDRDGLNKDRWNERMGMMRSSVFELGGSGFISFKLGGAKNQDLSYISIRDAKTDYELARFSNPKFNTTNFTIDPENYYEANLVLYKADLKQYLGQSLYLEICDFGGRDWDLLTFDSFITYHPSEPLGELAVDIKPEFSQSYITNQIPNGDFSQNLDFWTVSNAMAWENNLAFYTDNGVLKSNVNGDEARGLVRSSLFRIDGSGIISFEIGAAKGARYDKDTYISIREEKTNREILRIANTRNNGSDLIKYYVDLSEHMGKNVYLEIVDNARNSYDAIFVANIITYYAVKPEYDFGQAGINLNY